MGGWVDAYSALTATDKAILFQFLSNYNGSSSLVDDERNIPFHQDA